jgi:hypothetical protein
MGQFAVQLRAFAELAGANMDLVVQKATIDLASAVILRTPVGNPENWKTKPPAGYVGGRLRANWQFNVGAPMKTYLQTTDHAGVVTKIQAAVLQTGAGGVTWLTNNAPYAARIEYEGWSNQSPAGMVRVSVTEFQQYLNKAVASIKV